MRSISFSCIKCLNIIKLSLLPKMNSRFRTIFIKVSTVIFEEPDRPILKFKWKKQNPREARLCWRGETMDLHSLISEHKVTVINITQFTQSYKWKSIRRLGSSVTDLHMEVCVTDGIVKDWEGRQYSVGGAERLNYSHGIK